MNSTYRSGCPFYSSIILSTVSQFLVRTVFNYGRRSYQAIVTALKLSIWKKRTFVRRFHTMNNYNPTNSLILFQRLPRRKFHKIKPNDNNSFLLVIKLSASMWKLVFVVIVISNGNLLSYYRCIWSIITRLTLRILSASIPLKAPLGPANKAEREKVRE